MKKLNKVLLIVVSILSTTAISAQSFQSVDNDPHDIAYYRESRISIPLVKVLYGRPSVAEDTEVFGSVIPFGELWRTGANEATEIKFYKDTFFGNIQIKAGTYVLYTIPGEREWEIILSSNTDVLGAFQYDPLFDVAKIKVPVRRAESLKTFSIAFKKQNETTAKMVLAWGSTRVKVPLNFEQDEYLVENIKKHKLPTP